MADGLLVLWDIDLTLIRTDGVATEAYAAALQRTLDQPWRGNLHFNGLTERAMAERVLRMHDVEPDETLVDGFLVRIVEELHLRADAMRDRGRALTGAAAALEAVAAETGMRQSVLTGNVRSVAELKLAAFGLGTWVDFTIGAYGDDAHERAALLPHAWRRTESLHGETYSPAQTVLIGDTPRDVEAALTHGAGIVAVASGNNSAVDLAAAGAEVVLDDLGDTGAVVAAIRKAAEAAATKD
jgi:phosphoglycolate phosphatase-like HAD superfamily hydrolase